jgi:HEAT repeat protein
MRQNKQSVSLPNNFRRWLLLALVAGLSLAAVNFERAWAQQPANSNSQKSRTKRITPLRTSDTADGSRVTITSDGELNDYSAYRSGDRFIVVVPQAEGAGGGGARGRGFEGAQVEKRGKDLVYTFKLQPGATARVNQRFNRLDVQFSAPKGANAANAAARATPTPAATPARRTLPEEAGITKPPANANTQPTPDARRTPDANVNNAALGAATPFVIPTPAAAMTPEAMTSPTLAPTPATPGTDQIAQAQPSLAPPTAITTGVPSTAAPTSVGAVVTRNWPWLLAALLAVGIGLFFVSRFSGGSDRDQSRTLPPASPSGTTPVTVKETKTPELKPSSASTSAATTGAFGGTTAATDATPAVAAGATAAAATGATAASLAASGKQSKKKKKKAEKAKRLADANETKPGGATADMTGATTADMTGATTANGTTDAGTAGGVMVAASGLVAGAGALVGAAAVDESKAEETKAVEAAAMEPKAVEPSVAFDPERIEDEIKKLLAGESYDESIINTTDEGTRQLVSAELMQAVGGRNATRQAHARTAFFKHGYFEAATRALQSAEAPGERAAAARTLGILGDRSATTHLTAALEDPSADVRRTAVEALGELRDPAAVGALEALRWRETSRQVPRTLIQRAIEASKVEEEEVAAPAVVEVEDAATTPVVAEATAPSATGIAEVEATQLDAEETATSERAAEETETKELELAYAIPVVAEVTSDVAEPTVATEETDAADAELTVESPVLAATETHAPEPSFAVEEAATAETMATGEETKAIELHEPEVAASTSPRADFAPQESATGAESNTTEAAHSPVEPDLAATLAAKEASLIEARRRESEAAETADATDIFEPLAATSHADTQPVYNSDFAAGSGHPAAGDDDWIDLDADEQEVTIQASEPVASSPADSLGPFYAEGTGEQPATPATDASAARHDETVSLFDSLEVETFETNAIEPTPIVAAPVAEPPVRVQEADTRPLPFQSRPQTAASDDDDAPRGTEIVKAEKGLSIVDGSDEDTYSIIPKGIQLRLTSDDASERAASVLALSRLNTDEAFDQICSAFDDPAEEVRNAAARAIYELNEDRADSFTRALRESPVERRRHIGAALAGSGLAEEAIGNLTGESRDKTYDAFSLLFLMAKAGEVAPLIRAIESHHDNEVRLAVVKLLALSGQHEILPSFRRLAVRGSLPTEVRSAVMEAIYQISSQPNAPTPAA